LIVYDTDLFLQETDHKKIRNSKQMKKTWYSLTDKRVKVFLQKHKNKNILFVGDLNNGSPDGTRYTLPLKNVVNIFYTVEIKTLIKRYYKRDVCEGLIKDDEFLNSVIEGHYNVPSTKEFIRMIKQDIEWHKKRDYAFMDEKQILILLKDASKHNFL